MMGKTSWNVFTSYLASGPDATTDTSGILEARLQPWIAEALAGLGGGMRRSSQESIVGFFNMTTQGIMTADKIHFTLQQVTALCSTFPKSFVAVVILPNQAGDLRSSPTK